MRFDALAEVQKLKYESKLIAGSRKKTSKLDFSIATAAELQIQIKQANKNQLLS